MVQLLANKIRPQKLNEFIGQEHLIGINKPLRIAIEQKHLFSFVLWGPPGSGKTTLARIYVNELGAQFFELSAVSAGKADIKKILDKKSDGKSKVLFLDEIHRLNKSQQDYLLPFVETGELTLIGATTENPSFEIISPLLSRCRVFVLNELKENEMREIIGRAKLKIDSMRIDEDAISWLIAMANGDARQVLTMLENTNALYGKITVENLKNTLQSKFLRYDKKGE